MGEWNKGRIVAKGNQIEHWLNGEKVVEITWGTDDWKERFQKSKYRKNEGFGSWERSGFCYRIIVTLPGIET